jgi:hypothetical protein
VAAGGRGHRPRLFLEHTGFDLDDPVHRFANDRMGPGWRDEVRPELAGLLDREHRPAPSPER